MISKRLFKPFAGLACLMAIMLSMAACDGGGSSSAGSSDGTLQVALTDAVDPRFDEAWITIREVRAVPAAGEGPANGEAPLVAAFSPPLVVNVLDLAYRQQLLGEALIPAGSYTQLRLVLEENDPATTPANYVVLAGQSTMIPVKTPSGQESGLKIIGRYVVAGGETTAVALDFDPSRAIVEAGGSGQWIFKPTGIRMVQMDEVLATYGAISGSVAREETAGTPPVTTTLPLTDARVYAVPAGETQACAAGQVDPEDGSFRIFLPPVAAPDGYELKITADGFAPYSSLPTLYPVATGTDTGAGTVVLSPITP